MGIGIHIDGFECKSRWSYCGYHNFRKKVASSLGLILDLDDNFKWAEQDWDKWPKNWLYFLTKNDCTGFLTPFQCKKLYPELREILQKWPENDYDREKGFYLAEAMEFCHKNKKRMFFS